MASILRETDSALPSAPVPSSIGADLLLIIVLKLTYILLVVLVLLVLLLIVLLLIVLLLIILLLLIIPVIIILILLILDGLPAGTWSDEVEQEESFPV